MFAKTGVGLLAGLVFAAAGVATAGCETLAGVDFGSARPNGFCKCIGGTICR